MRLRYRLPGWKTLGATTVAALIASLSFTLSKPMELRVDGQPLVSDVPPITTPKGGVFVPLRPVGAALGAETRYERKSGAVVVQRGDQTLAVKVGSTKARLNGMPLTLGHAPFRVRGRVMVGLKTVQQAFDMRARIDRETASVELDTPGFVSPTL